MAYGFNGIFLVLLLGAFAIMGVVYLALVWVIAWTTTTVADRLPPENGDRTTAQ